MSKFLSMVCSAAAMLAVSSGAFADSSTSVTVKTSSDSSAKKPCFFEQGMALTDDGQYLYEKDSNGKCVPVRDADKRYPNDAHYGVNGRYPYGFAAPAGVALDNSMDLNVNAAFTYMYYSQDAMDVANVVPSTVAGVVPTPGSVVYQNFGYKPGFKIGIGLDTNHDGWAVGAEYTWFHHTKSQTVALAGMSANDWFVTDPLAPATYGAVTSSWLLHTDMIDVGVSRPFYQSPRLVITPCGGLRALWIRQNEGITLSGGALSATDVSSGNTSNSWSLGPKGGMKSNWIVWKGLRVESMVGASLLYTQYTHITNTQTTVDGSESSTTVNYAAVRPATEMGLGLGWGSYMFNNKFFFDLSARYDFAQYWSQNVMRNYASQLQGYDDAIGDLMMHGLTLTLRCDF